MKRKRLAPDLPRSATLATGRLRDQTTTSRQAGRWRARPLPTWAIRSAALRPSRPGDLEPALQPRRRPEGRRRPRRGRRPVRSPSRHDRPPHRGPGPPGSSSRPGKALTPAAGGRTSRLAAADRSRQPAVEVRGSLHRCPSPWASIFDERRGDYDAAFAAFALGSARKRATLGDEPAVSGRSRKARDREPHPPRPSSPSRLHDATSYGGGSLLARASIFIVGLPRSGTTLVEQILATHPKVQGMGESDTPSHALSSAAIIPFAAPALDAGPDHYRRLADGLSEDHAPAGAGKERLGPLRRQDPGQSSGPSA